MAGEQTLNLTPLLFSIEECALQLKDLHIQALMPGTSHLPLRLGGTLSVIYKQLKRKSSHQQQNLVDIRGLAWLKLSQHSLKRSSGHLELSQRQYQAHMCRDIPNWIKWILYTLHVELGNFGVCLKSGMFCLQL